MKSQKFFAELLGTGFLTMSILGSGMMAKNLTDNSGVQLLIVAIATVVTLGLMIALMQPISGAHFNPAVSLIAFVNKQMKAMELFSMVVTQVLGALLGAVIANVMFGHAAFESATTERTGSALLFSEVVATAGLIFSIMVAIYNGKPQTLHWIVPLWIGGAYFFTSSTTFANPAVTFARTFSDSLTGISLSSAGLFILAQFIGAFVGLGAAKIVKNN
jgi:glycerol uptake facilitator-like aquaporin